MTPKETVEGVCRLPRDYRTIGTINIHDLLERAGYYKQPEVLTRDRIEDCLRQHPEWIEDWFIWSDDQRVTEAWVFSETSKGYIVYYYPVGESMKFTDKIEACAEFILRQIAWMTAPTGSRR